MSVLIARYPPYLLSAHSLQLEFRPPVTIQDPVQLQSYSDTRWGSWCTKHDYSLDIFSLNVLHTSHVPLFPRMKDDPRVPSKRMKFKSACAE
jgi:hypothetical protein